MNICDASPASKLSPGVYAQSLHKIIMMVVALLILVTVFFLTIAPTATAAPTYMSVHTSPASELAVTSCGEVPGFCPTPFGAAY